MNVELFKSTLLPYWRSWSINDLDDAADKIATAYELSNIADSGPFFGAKLIKGDKDKLKQFLSLGLKTNFYLKSVSQDSIEPGFTLMATGFCLYWVQSTFTPMPPMPPMIAPTTGVQVLFPGLPKPLDKALKDTFKHKEPEQSLTDFGNALVLHLLTLAGTYSGLFYPPASPSPVPLVLPWTGVLSLPGTPAGSGVPNILKNQDTDKDGTPDYLDPDIDNDGLLNEQDDDKDGDGILNKDEPGKIAIGGTSGIGGGGGGGTGTSGTTGTSGGGTGTRGTGGTTGTSGTKGGSRGGFVNTPTGNIPKGIKEFFIEQTEYVFNTSNKFKLVFDKNNTKTSKIQIVVQLHESVYDLSNGEREWQFAMFGQIQNLAYNDKLNNSEPNLPFVISEYPGYSYPDVIESNKLSNFSTIILPYTKFTTSVPGQRGLELMKQPFRTMIDNVINTGGTGGGIDIGTYASDWYGGKLPTELTNVRLVLVDSVDNSLLATSYSSKLSNRTGLVTFKRMNIFKQFFT